MEVIEPIICSLLQGRLSTFMLFVVNEHMDFVSTSKTFYSVIFLLIYTFNKITGNSNIELTIPLTGHYIDVELLHSMISCIPVTINIRDSETFAGMTTMRIVFRQRMNYIMNNNELTIS